MRQFLQIEDAAEFYSVVMELCLVIMKNTELKLLQTRYEDMVLDFESSVKRILRFLDVEWDDALLDYYKLTKSRYVNTPSNQAVAQPIYSNAIGKWKNYSQHLEPVLPLLKPYIEQFEYADK
jgi:hypothetical protein